MKLDQVVKKQDQLETMINEQKDKINEILSKLEQNNDSVEIGGNNKGKNKKNKGKRNNEFYQVIICFIILLFIIMLYLF